MESIGFSDVGGSIPKPRQIRGLSLWLVVVVGKVLVEGEFSRVHQTTQDQGYGAINQMTAYEVGLGGLERLHNLAIPQAGSNPPTHCTPSRVHSGGAMLLRTLQCL